jgi:hypothetical protein
VFVLFIGLGSRSGEHHAHRSTQLLCLHGDLGANDGRALSDAPSVAHGAGYPQLPSCSCPAVLGCKGGLGGGGGSQSVPTSQRVAWQDARRRGADGEAQTARASPSTDMHFSGYGYGRAFALASEKPASTTKTSAEATTAFVRLSAARNRPSKQRLAAATPTGKPL